MRYPITIAHDSAGLDAPLVALSKQPPVLRVGIGGAVGALTGHLLGKHALIGALLGAAGGYVAAAYIPKS